MHLLRRASGLVWRHMLTIVLALGVAYLGLQRFGYLLRAPAMKPSDSEARQLFPIDFTLLDVAGQTIRLSDLRGRVVLLNFWATWCPPCRAEMPSMQALYEDYREQGLEIVAISSDVEDRGVVSRFVNKRGFTFPVLLDPHNTVGSRVRLRGIPTSYLLDKQGRIVGRDVGARNWSRAAVRRLLDRLLAESNDT